MKKITLGVLVFFFLVVLGIFGMSLAYPTIDTQNTDTVLSGDSIPMAEIALHNVEADCYLLIDKKVYDVTTYISKHPGGRKNITSRCGQEVTGIFASIHSNAAWDLLSSYYIGNLQE